MESIDTGWAESLTGVAIELHSVKFFFRFLSGKIFVSLEKVKSLKQYLIWKYLNLFDLKKENYLIDSTNIYMEKFMGLLCDV